MTLELKDVALRAGGEVHIHPTRLTLAGRGFNTLLGETLAGKTTLLRLMAGLARPSEGEVWFGGRDVTGVPVQRRRVSMVYQQFINYPHFSVYENIASPLRVTRLAEGEIRARVGRIAELLQLSPLLERRTSELSGGQQQRTALARALVKEADLVLLDEPLANLDYKLREALRDELPRLFASQGCTVVYATTEPAEALLLGGHVATLHEGRVTQFGPALEVYRAPADLTSARVFSDPPINVGAARKRDGRIELADAASWPAPDALATVADGDITVALRPHHVRPAGRAQQHSGPGANGRGVPVSGPVLISEISGSESVIHFGLGSRGDGDSGGGSGGGAAGTWVAQAHGVQPHPVGEAATFVLDIAHCLYFDAAGRRLPT